MSRATPQMRDLAGGLIAYEISDKTPAPADVRPAAFAVCEKLGPQLVTLMGRGGYHALLSRALVMSRAEVDWLRAVSLTETGDLALSDEIWQKVEVKEQKIGSMVLVAELLGLLVAFIGDNLTLRLVRDVWPHLSLKDSNFTQGDHP